MTLFLFEKDTGKLISIFFFFSDLNSDCGLYILTLNAGRFWIQPRVLKLKLVQVIVRESGCVCMGMSLYGNKERVDIVKMYILLHKKMYG